MAALKNWGAAEWTSHTVTLVADSLRAQVHAELWLGSLGLQPGADFFIGTPNAPLQLAA